MKFDDLTTSQKKAARNIRDELNAAGIAASVSQVAVHFDDVMAWKRGEITTADLCAQTGWALPAATEPDADPRTLPAAADDPMQAVHAAKLAYATARQNLRAALRAAKGHVSANALAAELDGMISRPVVLKILGEETLYDRAFRALVDANFGPYHYFLCNVNRRGAVTLDLTMEGHPVSTRQNTASAILEALRKAKINAHQDGIAFNLPSALADGETVELEEA